MTVSNIKAESCYLHWEAPLDNGGSELTNYIVEKMEVMKEEPELEEGQEVPPEPQWVEVTNSIIDKKYGVCPDDTNYNDRPLKPFLTLITPHFPTGVEPRDQQDLPIPGQS